MEGWIKIHRNITKWEWYDDSKTVHLFFHLLLSANHKDGNWRGQEVKRGQVITGRKKLSAVTGISERSIRTCLERLESTNEVTIKTTTKNSVITIVKYDLYQGSDISDQRSDQQTTNDRPSTDQRSTTNKNVNNENNEKNIKGDGLTPTQKVLEFVESDYNENLVGGFKRFTEFIEKTKHVKNIPSQINITSYQKICDEHTVDKLKQKITELDNWLDDPNISKGKKNKKSLSHLMNNTWLKNGY